MATGDTAIAITVTIRVNVVVLDTLNFVICIDLGILHAVPDPVSVAFDIFICVNSSFAFLYGFVATPRIPGAYCVVFSNVVNISSSIIITIACAFPLDADRKEGTAWQ
jgi:hypothetical protein